ncbi:Sodium/solute symporter [Cinara cedri]|uniref:Sodium/solute symporter n=1 Tax=Cinara cedri TaxID=506608 RepID=A0A5E4NBQ1_9HEMI|nr:Sodium/solute symporter [Cinara cedri]
MEQLNWMAEYAAFAVMLSMSVFVGLYYGCVDGKQNTINEYLLGGKHMAVFPITMSMISSHISGITLLGVPSEVYSHGTQYLVMALINVFVITITIHIYLPVFYELQITSVFEYLEHRFGTNIRVLTSMIFALSQILILPVVIYIPALAFNQVTGLDIHLMTIVMCIICIFYTTVGGLKAVVWTDAIQSVFTTVSLIFVTVLGLIEIGGIGNTIRDNRENGRLEFFKMDPNPFLRNTFWTVGLGTIFGWVTQLSIHPGIVQRFISLPTYKKARNSLIYFLFGVGVVITLTGIIGMIIYSKYKDCDPVMANYIQSDRNILPYYIMDVAANYPGLTGLFISGIVSAALSTMSAQLNTLSGTIYEDFVVKMMSVKVSELTASIIMKCTVVIIGFLCVGLVLVVEKLSGIVQMAISVCGITNGAILSVFTLGICFPRANSRGAICGMMASLGIMTWIIGGAQLAIINDEMIFTQKDVSIAGCPANTTFKNQTDYSGLYLMNEDVYVSPNVWKIHTVSYMHYNTVGTLVGIGVGLLVSYLFPTDQKVDLKLLAPCIRRFMYHDSPNPECCSMKEVKPASTINTDEKYVHTHDTKL